MAAYDEHMNRTQRDGEAVTVIGGTSEHPAFGVEAATMVADTEYCANCTKLERG